MGGAGLIPAIHWAASFTVAPGRRSYPAPGSAGSRWQPAAQPAHPACLQQQMAPGGYFMPAPQQVPGTWAGQPMAMPPPWGMPAGGPAMRYAAQPPQVPLDAAPGPAPGQQGPAPYQAQDLTAGQQQALYDQQLQAQQAQQAYMWQAQQQQMLYYQQAQVQMAAVRAQAVAQGLHADEPLFAREPMPQVPVALDPSGRPFKASFGGRVVPGA